MMLGEGGKFRDANMGWGVINEARLLKVKSVITDVSILVFCVSFNFLSHVVASLSEIHSNTSVTLRKGKGVGVNKVICEWPLICIAEYW